MNKDLMMLHNYAEMMAEDVMRGDMASICLGEGTPDEVVWTAYRSDEDENVVVFACEGESYEYEYKDKEALADAICDFFSELWED